VECIMVAKYGGEAEGESVYISCGQLDGVRTRR